MTDGPPRLVLGPIVRGANPTALSVWVETSAPCEVEVAGRTGRTFRVAGHHYALVDLVDLDPGAELAYDVRLDGQVVWPDPDRPQRPPVIATWAPPEPYRIVAGSCRQQAPEPLWLRHRHDSFGDLGPDALAAVAIDLQQDRRPRPHLALLTGDQVYADEQHRSVRRELQRRRGGPPRPGFPEITSFEEYTWLYQKTWSQPLIRWLLSNVPSLMIFDDHDVIDDWNISAAWAAEMAELPWWADRAKSALMSYWVYQHLGNLTPEQRAGDELYRAVVAADDGGPALAAYAEQVATGDTARLTSSWSFHHRIGPLTVVVLDARNGRVLDPDRRSMLSPTDWAMLDRVLGGDVGDHLLIVSSVPWILPKGIHRLEEWISFLAGGRAGRAARAAAERIRRAVDLEHWAAFGDSFRCLHERLASLDEVTGPASIAVLSGDVHFAYIARVELGKGRPPAHQIVSSPLRQVEMSYERLARRISMTRPFRRVLDRAVERLGDGATPLPFEIVHGPWFRNNIASLTYDGDVASARLERVGRGRGRLPTLATLVERQLSAPTPG